MDNKNLTTRKRIFELIDKLYSKKDCILFLLPKIQLKEFYELIDLLSNKNPYIDLPKLKVEYKDYIQFLDSKIETIGLMDIGNETIQLHNKLVKKSRHNPRNFFDVISVIGHEKRHYEQDLNNNEDLLTISNIKNALYSGYLKKEDIKEINDFILENNLNEKNLTKEEINTYRFGAYLSTAHEIDARNHEYTFTKTIYESLTNDPLCNNKIKRKLEKSFERYEDKQKTHIEHYNKQMEKFSHLRKKLKDTFNLIFNNNEDLIEEKYLPLLDKVMIHISKDMTPNEKVKYIDWAIEKNHTNLLRQISFDTNESEKSVIAEYVSQSIDEEKIKPQNARDLFIIHSMQYKDSKERVSKNTELAIKMINDKQIRCLPYIIDCVGNNSLDYKELTNHLIPYAEERIKFASKESFDILVGIKSTIEYLMYQDLNADINKELKSLYEECSNKVYIFNPIKNDEIGNLLNKIRAEQEEDVLYVTE